MFDWLITHEPLFRVSVFAGMFALMATWEMVAAKRPLLVPKGRRWLANMAMVGLNAAMLRVVFPTAGVGVAVVAAERGWGLFAWLGFDGPVAVVVAVLLLDLVIYVQHVVFHAVPVLWRLHRVHHADLDIDVTTGTRFHSLEILLSMGIKLAFVIGLGLPVVGVLLFEVILNATAMFNHGNVRLPPSLDRVLRWLVVTPDMHRVHHSTDAREYNSNFGFSLPIWDRLFHTYRAQPADGHEQMQIGLPEIRDTQPQSLLWMLTLPFESSKPGSESD